MLSSWTSWAPAVGPAEPLGCRSPFCECADIHRPSRRGHGPCRPSVICSKPYSMRKHLSSFCFSVRDSTLLLSHKSRHRPCREAWAHLCANKTLLKDTGKPSTSYKEISEERVTGDGTGGGGSRSCVAYLSPTLISLARTQSHGPISPWRVLGNVVSLCPGETQKQAVYLFLLQLLVF